MSTKTRVQNTKQSKNFSKLTVKTLERNSSPKQNRGATSFALTLLLSFMTSFTLFCLGQALAADLENTQHQMEKGLAFYNSGKLGDAAASWENAAKDYSLVNDVEGQTKALIRASRAFQKMGQLTRASRLLHTASKLSGGTSHSGLTAQILGRMGNIYFAKGDLEKSYDQLIQALSMARRNKHSLLVAVLLNDLGNVLTAQQRYSSAITMYTECMSLAEESQQDNLVVTALINSAKAAMNQGLYDSAKDRLDLASERIHGLPDNQEKANAWLNIGASYQALRKPLENTTLIVQRKRGSRAQTRGVEIQPGTGTNDNQGSGFPDSLDENFPPVTQAPSFPPLASETPFTTTPNKLIVGENGDQLILKSANAFHQAIKISDQTGDFRSQSYAWSYLGQLYEQEKRYEEALDLTRRGILTGQRIAAPEALYRWHWQTARLLNKMNRYDEALLSYRRAVGTIQPIRRELLGTYRRDSNAFGDSVSPVFYELVNLLFQRADSAISPEQNQSYLKQARDTLESLKTIELEEYFQSQCVAETKNADLVGVLGNHTAVIYPVIFPDKLELLVMMGESLKKVTVPVTKERLRQEANDFRIKLQEPNNQSFLIDAGKLYDRIIKPLEENLDLQGISTLVFVPDGILRTVPMAALHDGKQYLVAKYAIAVTPAMSVTNLHTGPKHQVNFLSAGLTKAVQGFPALPHVKTELDAISNLYGGKRLMNEKFVVPAMAKEMKSGEFSVVHIASHGLVHNDINKSFILAFDDKMTMNNLSDMVRTYKFGAEPLELLTLSACETAVGDDRAALGLAGVAVRAGANSVLATLWFIDDEAAAELVSEFYHELKIHPKNTKAVALQKAQLKILSNPMRNHPNFWAPFLILSNWL